jgi:general stress protein YciG
MVGLLFRSLDQSGVVGFVSPKPMNFPSAEVACSLLPLRALRQSEFVSQGKGEAMDPNNPFPPSPPEKKKRGFASMDRNQVRELARRGGVAAHRAGTAHEFSGEEARAAGRKGGIAAHSSDRKPRANQTPANAPEPTDVQAT